MTRDHPQFVVEEWVSFPGGELEGKRPKNVCRACRTAGNAKTICFQCYRADLERDRALRAAAAFDTGSEARFQSQLPFEPVNRPRLERLKRARTDARAAARHGHGRYECDRRQAQIAARHALQQLLAGVRVRGLAAADREQWARALFSATHAAELHLPASWLPFVVSR